MTTCSTPGCPNPRKPHGNSKFCEHCAAGRSTERARKFRRKGKETMQKICVDCQKPYEGKKRGKASPRCPACRRKHTNEYQTAKRQRYRAEHKLGCERSKCRNKKEPGAHYCPFHRAYALLETHCYNKAREMMANPDVAMYMPGAHKTERDKMTEFLENKPNVKKAKPKVDIDERIRLIVSIDNLRCMGEHGQAAALQETYFPGTIYRENPTSARIITGNKPG